MADEQKLPILYVVPTGQPEFRRLAIADEQNRFWNGQGFSQSGQLYARHHEAALQLHAILRGHFEGVEPVRLVAPVVVEVFSHTPTDHLAVAQGRSPVDQHERIRLRPRGQLGVCPDSLESAASGEAELKTLASTRTLGVPDFFCGGYFSSSSFCSSADAQQKTSSCKQKKLRHSGLEPDPG